MKRVQDVHERGAGHADQQPAAYSVPEFCRSHRISRALFYVMRRAGVAPAVFKAGRRTLISAEAAARWRADMEAKSAEEA